MGNDIGVTQGPRRGDKTVGSITNESNGCMKLSLSRVAITALANGYLDYQ
jgi:hypothetical protein